MKIAKDCPFCGEDIGPVVARQGTKYTFYQVMHQPNKKGRRHGLIIMDVDEWNTRPIEDALNARIAELEELIEKLVDEGCVIAERFSVKGGSEADLEDWENVIDEYKAVMPEVQE